MGSYLAFGLALAASAVLFFDRMTPARESDKTRPQPFFAGSR